jgi:prepilin-type N-terminal cleavage/methylation domain-containing protein
MRFFQNKAFTLVELLVVIAIVGLLSTIVLVSTSGLREQAEITKTLTWAKSIDSLLGADAVGIWNMDEASASNGTQISDISGWGNDGTLVTNNGTDSKSVPGVINGALSFDGDGDYVDCGNKTSLNIDNNFTIEIWLKSNQDKTYSVISKGSWFAIYQGWHISTAAAPADLLFEISDNSTRQYLPFNTGRIFDWTHIVAIRNGNKILTYTNSEKKSELGVTVGSVINNLNLMIGRQASAANVYFNGLIDEVRIYDTALTASQVQLRYYIGLDRLLAKGLISQKEYNQRLALK